MPSATAWCRVITGFGGSYPTGGGDLAAADLVKSNFDPNTRSGKELPDQLVWRWIDKTDLTVWSTEGSLHPTGRQRVTCLGRLLGPGGRLIAQEILSLEVESFRLLRQTTQADFVGGRPELHRYLSRSTGDPTTGETASWNTWGAGRGLSAMTYPCPPQALPALAADGDGAVAFATVQADHAPPLGGALLFLHHFDDGWDADVGGTPSLVPHADNPGLLPVQWNRSVWPVTQGEEPNTLYPDGMHAQVLRSPAYRALGVIPQRMVNGRMTNRVGLSYWVKSMTEATSRPTVEFLCSREGGLSNKSQTFMVGSEDTLVPGKSFRYGCQFESRMLVGDLFDQTSEYVALRGQPATSLTFSPFTRWRLVTAYVDTAVLSTASVRMQVQGGPASFPQVWDGQGNYLAWDLTLVEDLLTGAGPQTCFFLGVAASQLYGANLATANQVMDEFAIYDFADAGLSEAWAQTRSKEGRYYKGGDAWFLSPSLIPAAGAPGRLLSVRWTAYLPRESRMEVFANLFGKDYKARLPDPVLADDARGNPRAWIELELLTDAGALLQKLSQDGRIDRFLPAFRYRVRLRTQLEDPVDQPLLETPWFDDITFFVQSPGGPRVMAWSDAG